MSVDTLPAVLIVVFTFLANLGLAVVVWHNNPKSWTNRLLTILTLIFSAWTIFNFLALRLGSEETRLFWVRIVMMVTAPMGAVTYLLATVFPKEKLDINKKILLPVFLLTLIIIVLSLTSWMFVSLKNLPNGNFNLNPGPALALFALSHIGFTVLGFIVLIKKFYRSKGRLRYQLVWFLWGNVLTLTLITVSNFFAVIFLDSIQYTFIGPAFTLFQAGFITYAIVKHRLLDIRLLVVRSIAYSLLLVSLGLIYAGGMFLFTPLFFKGFTAVGQLIVSTFFALIIALSFQSLKESFKKATDRFLYKNRYHSDELLHYLSQTMATTIDLRSLSDGVLSILKQQMRLSHASSIVFHNDGVMIVTQDHGLDYSRLGLNELRRFRKLKKILVFEELPEGKTKEFLRKWKISVLVPLETKEGSSTHFVGLLVLGEKSSGDIYFDQDIKILNILGPQLAVALQNAKSVEEIKHFNFTLQAKIKQATKRIRRANKRLKEIDRLKDEFMSVAAHQLRTPVGSMRWNMEMLLSGDVGRVSKSVKEILRQVYQSNQRMIALINDLLNISRIEQGRVKNEPKLTNVLQVVKTAIKELEIEAKKKMVLVKIQVKGDGLTKIMIDPKRFREVVTNLLSNAIKYNKIKGRAVVEIERGFKQIIIKIIDTGIGVPKKDLKKIFSKFFRAENAVQGSVEGTGLGLFVVKSYVEGWGGKVKLESKQGQGTIVTLTLPLKPK